MEMKIHPSRRATGIIRYQLWDTLANDSTDAGTVVTFELSYNQQDFQTAGDHWKIGNCSGV